MADTWPVEEEDTAVLQPWELPGTLRGREIQRREDQQGFLKNLEDGFMGGTALGAGQEIVNDEAQLLEDEMFPEGSLADTISNVPNPLSPGMSVGDMMSGAGVLLGFRAGEADYDPYEKYDELTEGIPYGFHAEIVGNDNYAAALRARERILNDMERGRRISSQQGFTGNLAVFAGSMVDVDLPLTFMTGGGYGAARVARAGVKFSAATRLGARTAHTVQSGMIGASSGLQAGLASGAAQMAWRDTADWTLLAETALTSTLMGGGINGVMRGDMGLKLSAARDELHTRMAADDPTLSGQGLDVEAMHTTPLVMDEGAGLTAIFTEPTTSTVNFPERNIVGKTAEQLAAADVTAASITKANGFTELTTMLSGRKVSKVAGGQEKVVLDVDGHIVRIGTTEQVYPKGYSKMNYPTHTGKVGDLYVEITPRVEMDLTAHEIVEFDKAVANDGMFWSDAGIGNLGRAEDGSIRVIDGVVLPPDRFESGFTKPIPGRQYPYTAKPGDLAEFPDINQHPLFAPTTTHADSTAGAQMVAGAGPRVSAERVNRANLDASPRLEEITTASENWRHESGWLNRKRDGETEWLESFVTRGAGKAVAQDYARLYSSESPTANFLAGAIFESPHGYGRGRATAAVLNDHYTKQIVEPTFEAHRAMFRWAKRNEHTLARSGLGISDAGNRAFSREIMLEVNARRQGRQYSKDPDVLAAAEAYGKAAERALDVAKGRNGQRALDGFEDIQAGPYLPYRWNGRRLRDLIRQGVVDEGSITQALANSYRAAGMTAGKDADAVAKAMVTRMRSQADGVSGSLQDLMHRDGRDFFDEMLKDAGVSATERAAIMDRITGNKNEAGKLSHAKNRNEIDLEGQITTKDGSVLRIVDLMDDDLNTSWQRYSRQMAGSAALARHGITNRSMRESVISAIQKEQDALGEKAIDGDLLRAMLTHFDGGPISGYAFGKTNKGLGVGPALAKRLTNLSLLGKLGITQLGETGASMAAVGLKNWVDRGVMSRLDPERLAQNTDLLKDIAFITGRIGEDHKHFAPHLELDSMSTRDASEFMANVQGWVGKAQFVQGYTSLFNQVRTWQQTTAALGIADKVVQQIKAASQFDEFGFNRVLDENLSRRLENDFGIDATTMDYIGKLIDDGVIEMASKGGHTYVNRLNMEQWDVEIADEFGAAITRSTNQQVQKSLAGEQDAWLHTEAGSLLMHLKTFPIQAATKQFARNMRYFDQENWGVLGMGLATAYLALAIRDTLDGRDRDAGERAKAAIGYSNMTGFIPMGVDPVMTMLGMEDMRFNQYGPHSEASVASLDVANRAMRIPGAAIDYATGNANGYDRQAMMAIPFMNTIGLSRMW